MAVSHDDVTALLHDPIADVGIVAFPNMESAELESFEVVKEYQGNKTISTQYRVKVWVSVTFYDSDKPDVSIITKCFSYAVDSGDKATGKAYSMAIKYCYLKTFMLESSDEEESRDNEKHYNQLKESTHQPNNSQSVIHKNDFPASDAQKGAMRKMGIVFKETISKQDASKMIETYNKEKTK
jgi:hypothetical protein